MQQLRDWQSGQTIDASHLQEPVRAVRELQAATGGAAVPLLPRTVSPIVAHFFGVVVATGPTSEEDFADARHWVRVVSVAPGLVNDPLAIKPLIVAAGNVVCATNIAGLSVDVSGPSTSAGGHTVAAGTPVHAFVMTGQDGTPHYLFSQSSQDGCFGTIACCGPRGCETDPPFGDGIRFWFRYASVVTDEASGQDPALLLATGDYPTLDDDDGGSSSASSSGPSPGVKRGKPYATHLAALPCGGPDLREGTPIWVHEVIDAGHPGTIRYWFEVAHLQACLPPCDRSSSSSSSLSSNSSSASSSSSSSLSSNSSSASSSNDSSSSPASASSSDSSATSSSDGRGSSGAVHCWHKWTSSWDCVTSAAGPVSHASVTEATVAPGPTAWTVTSSTALGCTFEIWVAGGEPLGEGADCEDDIPDAPAAPTGDDCCGSSSSTGGGSSSSGGSSGSSGDLSSGSEKSTAIVPAAWSPTGYAALFVGESPDVRFDDVVRVVVGQSDRRLPIDPRFIAVCEQGTVEVCGHAVDKPALVGLAVDGGEVVMEFDAQRPHRRLVVTIRLTGIRKGFRGMRFPSRTRNQFLHNERFINSAYPNE